jgi:nucleoside-diphosphate-sugar epimerase
VFTGDLTSPQLGMSDDQWDQCVKSTDSIIHCAASLNRKSAKACFNVNLRGTLEVVKLASASRDHHGLRRFSDVSTVAVAGFRNNEIVDEERIIEWSRSDYDPYARTKKFCEHMVHELLPTTDIRIFRPATVLGDSRFPETTQFDMVRAFVFLAKLPVLPFRPDWRMDIVPANYVGHAIEHVHMADKPKYDSYNLSSGSASLSYEAIVRALDPALGKSTRFAPKLQWSFTQLVEGLCNTPRSWGVAPYASIMKVFLPYLTNDTVFDNRRIVEELGYSPEPFDNYAYELFRFAVDGGYQYPYKPWPGETAASRKKVA